MERLLGTVVYGLRGPIINKNDNIAEIASSVLLNCYEKQKFKADNKDVFAITESVVARSQGNYITIDDIKKDLELKFSGKIDNLGLVFPILSRNRFSMILKGFAKASKKVTIQFSFPSDEVGNHLIDPVDMDEKGINPYVDVFSEQEWVNTFGRVKHTFTAIDYIEFYKEIVESQGAEFKAIFSNNVKEILNYTNNIILCDIHTRNRNYKKLENYPNLKVYTLDKILNQSIDGSGYNAKYGLLGSNKANDQELKLFPNECTDIVYQIQDIIKQKTGKKIEVMIYGDGAFKDPKGKIWELADPVVSPAFTDGLSGTPNELKLKYLADNDFKNLTAEQQKQAIEKAIKEKETDLKGKMATEGTTPRQLTDLLGSLCDLTSGSGDKGTPFIYIKGYFDNYAD